MYFKNTSNTYTPHLTSNYKQVKKDTTYHNKVDLKQSLRFNTNNNFIEYLKSIFPTDKVENIINLYQVGTATFWNNATIFWQIDNFKKIRSGKMMMYSKNGKRSKIINWMHSYQIKNNQLREFNLSQCFFGLHLINKSNNAIAIVESEKTACIMSILFDKYIWLAAGSLNGINEKKLSPIKDRRIILYPDLGVSRINENPYTQWKKKSDDLFRKGYNISTSDLLESKATEEQKTKGYDIADYFLKVNKERIIINDIKSENLNKLLKLNIQLQNLIEVFDLELMR
ncbi:hypothetical protein SAMN04488007_3489 [Maribacter aquivivus]|uniref:DUF6371 domain-containing protein n=1 Tax=Maribacter aquivivus TaxID=228958 RepID=A0A1M6U556_9FLAO|nr:hypothetical protein SAMN04488007_3489 [Maribacter aquivivus]